MSFINVTFGYNQSKIFNINCEIATILDAIHTNSYKEMKAKLTTREEFFNKEIANFKKEQASMEKKLEKLETPPEPPKAERSMSKSKAPAKKKTKKELEEEEAARKIAEEEERVRKEKEDEERKLAEEEERKRKEEEEAAKKGKGKDKKKKDDDAPPEEVEETEEVKKEKEIQAVKDQIETMKAKIEQYSGKVKLCIEERDRQDGEEARKKHIDLQEKSSGDRKFLKEGSKDYGNDTLAERRCYVFVEIKPPKEGEDEEQAVMVSINGAAIRTPDEDIVWEAEQKELEANAPKDKGKPAKGKKK